MKKNKSVEIQEFNSIINEIARNETVLKMREYIQHFDTSCFDHCYTVSYYSYYLCKKFGWDYKSVTRAAMVHDLFLYDWRSKEVNRKGFHAFTHPKEAVKNASKLFVLSDKEKDIILKHMWPVTIHMPKSKEGFVLTFVDKYCAILEGVKYFIKSIKKNETLKYAYLVLSFVILKNR